MKTNHGLETNNLKEEDIMNIRNYISKFDIWNLIALETATTNMKSGCLAIALLKNVINIKQALEYSRLEENY